MRLQSKISLITGSTQGLGAAMARRFGTEGATVVVCGRSETTGRAVAGEVQAAGGDAAYLRLDVTDESSVQQVMDEVMGRWGRLDVVVNNAAATDSIASGGDGRAEALALDDFDRVMKVGVHGAFLVTKHAVPLMRAAGGGSIINISSVAGVTGVPHMCAYSASKGALVAMSRQWAQDLGSDAIRSNGITVGFIASGPVQEAILDHPVLGPSFDAVNLLARRGRSDDIASAAVYLASDDSSFVTGTLLTVDGGATSRSGFPDAEAVFKAEMA